MDKEELSKWFWSKFKSCYVVSSDIFPNHVYLYYDKSFIRSKKLCVISKKELSFIPNFNKGIKLFDIDIKYNMMSCDYYIIWSHLRKKFNESDIKSKTLDNDIQKFIQEILKYTRFHDYTPTYFAVINTVKIDSLKLKLTSLDINTILKPYGQQRFK